MVQVSWLRVRFGQHPAILPRILLMQHVLASQPQSHLQGRNVMPRGLKEGGRVEETSR